jgi:hypothetical protein
MDRIPEARRPGPFMVYIKTAFIMFILANRNRSPILWAGKFNLPPAPAAGPRGRALIPLAVAPGYPPPFFQEPIK